MSEQEVAVSKMENTTGCISREAAFNAVDKALVNGTSTLDAIRDVPPVDAVEVIRCTECRYFKEIEPPIGRYVGKCFRGGATRAFWMKRKDGFCAWGGGRTE